MLKGMRLYWSSRRKDPSVATICPSSPVTVKKITEQIQFDKDLVIVEYGTGEGAITRGLLKHLSPESKLIGLETNEELFHHLKHTSPNYPQLRLYDKSAEFVDDVLAKEGLGTKSVDYIISGIPFSMLDERESKEIVRKSYEALKDEGKFIGYQFKDDIVPALNESFPTVEESRVYLNVPPLLLVSASK